MSKKMLLVLQDGVQEDVLNAYRKVLSSIHLGTEVGIIFAEEMQYQLISFGSGDCLKLELPAKFLMEGAGSEEKEIFNKIKDALTLTKIEPVVILELPLDFLLESGFKVEVL